MEGNMTDRRNERDHERRERKLTEEADKRLREERDRRSEELKESWRRDHPSEEEERGRAGEGDRHSGGGPTVDPPKKT
jgi:hypothetical protein